jgi:hypothetical protein
VYQPRSPLASLYVRILAALLVLIPTTALAQTAADAGAPPAAPAESWAGQLDGLSRWFEQQHRRGARCTERCYTLDRLRITGRVGDGPLRFELTGGAIADGPVAIPLFGPPAHLRVEAATEDGRDAVIGFEGDHYFLYTAARRFVLKGTFTLDGDLALTIPGPLNALEADVTAGAVVEGARLSGLTGATIHFSREGAAQGTGPTVFQLSRAVRVGREIGFEYRLVMRSGTDLGVARLPLPFGEKVLDVTGSVGWHVEGSELVLPTSGRNAEMVVTGTLAKVGAFAPDARSGYEWWLVESDPEHRVTVGGDARQLDSAESPINRTQATSRLFLVQKGQHIEVGVQPLTSVDVLAAVVRAHQRMIVLTQRGDLVSDDTLTYENNGIDYLRYAPDGRPIYLATDHKAERIMHQGTEGNDVLVPLRTGSHAVRVQSLAGAAITPFAGRLDVPMSSYPLTASKATVVVGLPAGVFPVALLGGDRPEWSVDGGDALALLTALVVGWLAVRVPAGASRSRARGLRLLAGGVLCGVWFLAPGAFVALVTTLVAAVVVWFLGRMLRGAQLFLSAGAVLGLAAILCLFGLVFLGSRSAATRSAAYSDVSQISTPAPAAATDRAKDVTGNWLAQNAAGGVVEGVTPVALTMPSYVHTLESSRELVTRERPFRPTLYYVTSLMLWPIGLLWLAAAGLLLWAHKGPIAAVSRWVRERLQQGPASAPPPAPPPAEPPASPSAA